MNTTDGIPNPQRLFAFLATAASITMAVLNASLVNVALPVIANDFAIAPATAVWAVSAFQITVLVSLLPLSALGESLGYRQVYCTGLAIFTAASLVCAIATSFPVLVAARVLQGFGAAGILAVNPAIIRFIYPANMLGTGFGRNALIVAVATAIGPSVAAVILSVATWPWLFLTCVPIGFAALIVSLRTLPDTPRLERRFDWVGATLNALMFSLLVIGINNLDGTGSTYPLLLIAGAAVAGFIFVRHQMNRSTPLLPLDLLRIPTFALSITTAVCAFAVQMLTYVSLPFYFHDVLGCSVAETGLLMTPFPLAIAASAPIVGKLADRYPPGLLGSIGLALLGSGLGLIAVQQTPSAGDLVGWLALCGVGFSLFHSPNNKIVLISAPRERAGSAGGMLSTARYLGNSLGGALVAAVFGLDPQDPVSTILVLGVLLSITGCAASSFRIVVRG